MVTRSTKNRGSKLSPMSVESIGVDEASLKFHARESHKPGNREISRILNLSRQRQQTLIFVSQQARYLDKNVASAADVLVVKEPEPLQPKFERQEISEILKIAGEKFRGLTGSKREWSLVYSPAANFFDLLPNDLPSYWSSRCPYKAPQQETPKCRKPEPRKKV